ncbi:MAG TPA: hypothetical protein VMV53_06470 [Acidimicrobiales bacterium]|nr:hypothetical protein [Acidimicrobiales bacterium]
MTPTPPPIVARRGNLRARPGAGAPALPVRSGAPVARSALAPSPLRAFVAPTSPVPPLAFRAARLDRGRLHAPDAVAAAGLEVLCELEVRLAGPNRLRLRRRRVDDRPVRGTLRAHVDAGGRILVSAGLRHRLGVTSDGAVVVWAERGADGEPNGVLVVTHPGILVAALQAMDLAQAADDVDTHDGVVQVNGTKVTSGRAVRP